MLIYSSIHLSIYLSIKLFFIPLLFFNNYINPLFNDILNRRLTAQQISTIQQKQEIDLKLQNDQFKEMEVASKLKNQQQILEMREELIFLKIQKNEDEELAKNKINEIIESQRTNEQLANEQLSIVTDRQNLLSVIQKRQNDQEIELSKNRSQSEINTIHNDYKIQKTNMEKKYDDDKAKEKNRNERQIEEIQSKLVALQLSQNMEMASHRQDYENKIKEIQEKLKVSKDEILNLQNENNRQMELASNVKIGQQCRDNVELKSVVQILENEVGNLQNEITISGYLNQEISDVFLSCCDAMCEWDATLNIILAESNADTDTNSGKIQSNSDAPMHFDSDDHNDINSDVHDVNSDSNNSSFYGTYYINSLDLNNSNHRNSNDHDKNDNKRDRNQSRRRYDNNNTNNNSNNNTDNKNNNHLNNSHADARCNLSTMKVRRSSILLYVRSPSYSFIPFPDHISSVIE